MDCFFFLCFHAVAQKNYSGKSLVKRFGPTMMTRMEKATQNIALNIARYSADIKTLLQVQDIDTSIRLLRGAGIHACS